MRTGVGRCKHSHCCQQPYNWVPGRTFALLSEKQNDEMQSKWGCPFQSEQVGAPLDSTCHVRSGHVVYWITSLQFRNHIITKQLQATWPWRFIFFIFSLCRRLWTLFFSAPLQIEGTVEWESRHHPYCEANTTISFCRVLLWAWILSVRSLALQRNSTRRCCTK